GARRTLMNFIRLDQRNVVNEHLFVDDLDVIPRKTDGSLDVVLGQILWILENNDVATFDVLERQDRVQPGVTSTEHELVDEKMITNKKIVFHRRRGNLERLNDECRPEKRQYYRNDQRFEIFASRGFLVRYFNHVQILSSSAVFLISRPPL